MVGQGSGCFHNVRIGLTAERHWRLIERRERPAVRPVRPHRTHRRKALETLTNLSMATIAGAVRIGLTAERHWRPDPAPRQPYPFDPVRIGLTAERHWRHHGQSAVAQELMVVRIGLTAERHWRLPRSLTNLSMPTNGPHRTHRRKALETPSDHGDSAVAHEVRIGLTAERHWRHHGDSAVAHELIQSA